MQVDLVPPHVVVAWRHYFSAKYPSLRVVSFTSHPDPESSLQPQQKVHLRFKRARGRGLSAVGPKELLREVVRIHSGQGSVCHCVYVCGGGGWLGGCGCGCGCMHVMCVCYVFEDGEPFNYISLHVQRLTCLGGRHGWQAEPRRREALL